MIDLNKKYRHIMGYDVELYAIKGDHVMGAMDCASGWSACSWRLETHQLIEIKRRHKRTVWLNVYEDHAGGALRSKEDADLIAGYNRIACIKIDLDFEEGEGL